MKALCIIFIFLLTPLFSFAAMKVGVWKENITPTLSELSDSCIGGYGLPLTNPRCGVTEIHDYLSLRALYMESKDMQLSMLVFDTTGIGDSIIHDIRQRVKELTDRLNTINLVIVATHTHGGLDYQGIWGGIGTKYRGRIVDMAARTIIQAQSTAKYVETFAAQTHVPIYNRRGWDVVDDNVTTLFFNSRETNKPIATLVNLSAHPTILDGNNIQYSSDYIDSLRANIEGKRGGMTIFVNGILGDAQFNTSERTFEKAEEIGNLAANAILESEKEKQKVKGSLDVSTMSFNHTITNTAMLQLQNNGVLDINLNDKNQISVDLKYAHIGKDISLLTFPGEALSRLGLPIMHEMDGKYKLFVGLANASYGYFIPSDEFGTIPGRNTEEMFSMDKYAADRIKKLINLNIKNANNFLYWGDNDRKGEISDLYQYNNPYNGDLEYFKLVGLGNDGRYWYFPTDKTNNKYWEYIGPYEWCDNRKIGNIYLYKNPINNNKELFQLINLDNNSYFPTDRTNNKYWKYVGDVK
ncbi:hypothetical protein [Aliivibrio fischeri]|uniref:Neutral/alkaline non-lysosomal ceramidase N-terminal domain-containing protein n=1 Tax=Aliivibrio fischeri TaxID=668 RepID=A0A844P7H3_ALIFS|nr:hypothetical protein [Aliivibrio fischeri]MUK51185.1 hypothetical protein [Aliivibrio fischeri]